MRFVLLFALLVAPLCVSAQPSGVCTTGAPIVTATGAPLQGVSLACGPGATPTGVVVNASVALPLYPAGQAPTPAVANYGSLTTECQRALPGATACYSTDPTQNPAWLKTKLACGYDSAPVFIVACKGPNCAGEIFATGCSAPYPDANSGASYAVGPADSNIGGVITTPSDFAGEAFHSKYDATASLIVARRIIQQGRIPVFMAGSLLFGANGMLLPDAQSRLQQAAADFPDVFRFRGLLVEVIDEPFWNVGDPSADPSVRSAQVAQVEQAIAMIRGVAPAAQIGLVVAPVWNQYPWMVQAVGQLMPYLQWIAADTYAMQFSEQSAEGALYLAQQFAQYVRTYYKTIPVWLVIQGFAPPDGPKPATWDPAEITGFESFVSQMATVINRDFNGVFIWGWSNTAELPDGFQGAHFPHQVKRFFANGTAS